MKIRITPIVFYIVSALIFSSCASTGLSIKVLKPAYITVPKDIKTLAIANRSIASKESRAENIIEGVITNEGIFVDRFGSEECIKGLSSSLMNSMRYDGVTVPSNLNLRGTGTERWPEQLEWDEVMKICTNNKKDALVVLTAFDSDNNIEVSKVNREKKQNGTTVHYTEYVARLNVKVTSGWRIYDPYEKRIVDANSYTDFKTWEAADQSGEKAKLKLPPLDQAVKEAGYYSGLQYAKRISPSWVWVSRSYYKKGNADMKKGKKMVQDKEWERVEEMWKKYLDSPDKKVAGYAHHNMAIAAEVFGRLDEALEYAEKAYYDYGVKKSRDYIRELKIRIADQKKLENQLD